MTLQPPTQAPKPLALPFRIVSSHDEEGQGLPTIGLIGENFAGKTTMALSFPNPFFINVGNNSTLLAHPTPIPYVQVNKSPEMIAVANYVAAHKMSELVQGMGFPGYEVKTIVLDSTTDMSVALDLELNIDDTKRDGWQLKLAAENKLISKLIQGTRYVKGQEQYYLVLISHFKQVYGGKKGELTEIKHNVTGSFAQSLKGLYDICLEVRADQETSPDGSGNAARGKRPRHSVWTVPSHQFKTFIGDRFGGRGQSKGRFGKLPTEIAIPDGVGLFSLLEKHWHGEPPKLKATPEQVEKIGEIMGEFLAPK